jgi:dihydroorotase-like cyclic amidohydrolase
MSETDLIIRGRRVVLIDRIAPASIHIRDGRIVSIGDFEELAKGGAPVDVDDDSVVMPGLVDYSRSH